jgi:hypothetical protein
MKLYDECPEFVQMFGDLVEHAQQALLTLAAGQSLMGKEAIARQVDQLRQRLAATASSELEKLLIDRICISWIEVYHCDIDVAQHLLNSPNALPATQAATKRLDRAHARYLAAVRALATLQRLARPALSPLDLIGKPLVDRPARRTCPDPANGVAVAN